MMTSQEMMKTKAKPGYWWVNVAPLGSKPNWQEQVSPLRKTKTLFGYDVKEFMAKQYK
jgi:hypothetical protein